MDGEKQLSRVNVRTEDQLTTEIMQRFTANFADDLVNNSPKLGEWLQVPCSHAWKDHSEPKHDCRFCP